MKWVVVLLALGGCTIQPDYQSNSYQNRAFELIAQYNAKHGTKIPAPVVRVGTTANLDEGDAYCPIHADGCWLTINESMNDQRHGVFYSMSNTLPHELAHHICIYLKKCPRGNYHGKEWQEIASELGLTDAYFITD